MGNGWEILSKNSQFALQLCRIVDDRFGYNAIIIVSIDILHITYTPHVSPISTTETNNKHTP